MAKVFNNYSVATQLVLLPLPSAPRTHAISVPHTHTHIHTKRAIYMTHMAHFRYQLLSYFMYCAA